MNTLLRSDVLLPKGSQQDHIPLLLTCLQNLQKNYIFTPKYLTKRGHVCDFIYIAKLVYPIQQTDFYLTSQARPLIEDKYIFRKMCIG